MLPSEGERRKKNTIDGSTCLEGRGLRRLRRPTAGHQAGRSAGGQRGAQERGARQKRVPGRERVEERVRRLLLLLLLLLL